MGNPAAAARRTRSPQRKHFKESMAAKGVLCFVLISALATLATSRSPPAGYVYNPPHCACFNPFIGTPNEYKGDSDDLCGSKGPGFCYVPCNADCRDIQPTASSARCQSRLACGVEHGTVLQSPTAGK